jgi:hypothetical protein
MHAQGLSAMIQEKLCEQDVDVANVVIDDREVELLGGCTHLTDAEGRELDNVQVGHADELWIILHCQHVLEKVDRIDRPPSEEEQRALRALLVDVRQFRDALANVVGGAIWAVRIVQDSVLLDP